MTVHDRAITHVVLGILVRTIIQQHGGDVGVALAGSRDQRGVPVLQ